MNDAPRGPDWRATTPPTDRRGPHPLAAVVGLCALAAAGLGLLVWVQPARTAAVVCVSSSTLPDGTPVPFASADFARVTGDPLRRPNFTLPPDPTRDQLRAALAAMTQHPADQPLVLFLSGAAEVTGDQIELGAGVPGADHGRNRVTLTEVLEQVRAVKAAHKLVVLDFHTSTTDWVQAAQKCLENVADPRRLVLFARGIGEESHFGGGGVFVRYWHAGLRGAADGWAGGGRDNRVSVHELVAFVRSRTHRWAEQNRTAPQTPWLTGDGADFVLAPVTTPTTDEPEPTPDPAKVLEAWAVQDAWLTDGRADRAPVQFAALQRALRNMERDWQAGMSPDDARRAFDAKLASIDLPDPDLPDVLKSSPAPDATAVETLRRYLVRNEAVTEPTEKPPPTTAPVILAVASADPPPTTLQLKRLAKLLVEVEPDPAGVPSLLLRRLAGEVVSPERAARLLRNSLEFEALSKRAEFFAWGRVGLERAFAQWSTAVTFTSSPTLANPDDTDRALGELESTLRTLAVAADAHRTAVSALRRGERVLTKADSLDPLRASLVAPAASPDLNAAATTWAKLTTEVDAATRTATTPYQPPALAAVRRKASGSDAGPHELAELDRVLTFPLIPAKERAELWGVRLALAKRLDDATRERDRADDEDYAAGRSVPTGTDPREVPVPLSWVRRTVTRPAPAVFNTSRGEFLAWHAGRFDHLSRNPLDLPGASADGVFFARALDSCRRLGATVPNAPRLEIQAISLALTPAKRSGVVGVSVRLIGAEKPITTNVDVLSPAAVWVTTPSAGPVELSPVRAVIADRTLTVGTHPEKHPMLSGVLVRCEVGGRVFFKRVSVDTGSLSNRLELLVSTDPKSPTVAATSLWVRPNGQPAKFALVLFNPTTAPQTVVVQLTSPARETAAVTLEPGEKKPLAFPMPVPATPPASPPPEFDTAPAEFVILLLDPKTRQVRQTFTVPVRVTEPAELLDVREVTYSPSGELTARVGERVTFAGGDMPVSLTFPEDRNRGLTVADGKLSGVFVPGQGVLKLYVKRLKFEPSAGRTVTLAVSADGVERAFTFAGEAAGDAAVRFQPLTAPRVSIRADDFATGTAPLGVKVETDNAPPTATVEVEVGVEKGDQFVADFTRRDIPAKVRTVGVAIDPKGGLTLKATVGDPEPKVPLDRLVGKRVVVARLLDANGKELARDRKVIVFDGRRPQEVRFLDPPAKAAADKPLSVRATCDLPVSGVKEVHFFVGKPANDAPPPNAMLIAAKPADGRNEWAATIPLDGAKGPLDVSVRFTSKSGLVGFATITVERADAADINKPEPASVTGKVVEGTLAQPGLTVVLFDDKGKEKATAKTKDDGSFAFADLPPGKYTLVVEKTSTGRVKRLPIELKAGEEKAVELGLLLK